MRRAKQVKSAATKSPATFGALVSRIECALALLFLAGINTAFPQTVTQQQAATETYIQNLQLVPGNGNINFGYVTEDTSLGNYECGGLSQGEARKVTRVVSKTVTAIPGYGANEDLPKYMILCSKVVASGRPIGGIPVPPINLLMFDVSGNTDHLQHVVLHELFHLLEYRTDSFNDSEWQTRFGQGYSNSYTGATSSPMGSGGEGFINSYSRSFPHEERAELFAFLVLQPAQLQTHADRTLNEKIRYLVDKVNRLRDWDMAWR